MSKSEFDYFNYVVTVRKGTGPYDPLAEDNKYYSYADRVSGSNNLLSVFTAGAGNSLLCVMPVKTATKAHQIAEEWNRTYKANGTYLYA